MTESVDKIAIVTGGASGIGLGIARRLARDGAKVAIFDLDIAAADDAATKIIAEGGTAMAVQVDVSDRGRIQDAADLVRQAFGPITVLINNAGMEGFQPFLKITPEKWDRLLAVNLTGTFHCCQIVLPDMIATGWGRIVNISSSSTHGGQPFMAHYVASKSGVVGLTKSLALEFGPKGITVNTIPPGFIDTPMTRRNEAEGNLGDTVEHHAEKTPVRRAGRPEDIAAACAFLVSEEAGYITGQIIGVNGGRNT
ncbi:SDR family NAD(P)-dependent oxidoreductase [Mycobacterium sp. 1245805.9]|uniref:SDR family NAD(P)-dependent oxidoreductase n=1 Tax=Mycobacterium sp. 1245805.9 TaxID=1856862 RepID=UPI0007FB8621|nr:SDR family NAD(P)-dependent oxidoreductase [Mycobacterium sp. 1245805.9]OBI80344.1 short-chain dehydrogenase [Mycobacterium sp. 1245805.9]